MDLRDMDGMVDCDEGFENVAEALRWEVEDAIEDHVQWDKV